MAKDMTGLEKLLFLSSFVWALHWGTRVVSTMLVMDTVSVGVKMSLLGF